MSPGRGRYPGEAAVRPLIIAPSFAETFTQFEDLPFLALPYVKPFLRPSFGPMPPVHPFHPTP